MENIVIWILILAYSVLGDESVDCKGGKGVKLQQGLRMVCKNGVWFPREGRNAPGNLPCEDKAELSANGTCLAEEGHCLQFTKKGAEMDRDCAGTCESCDGCHCQDNHQWHQYCSYWAQYCHSPGVLETWMTSNCRKTCGKCSCKCCSYKGKQHSLGARIQIPEKCGELVCEEGLVAGISPLVSGAVQHDVTHPEALTLAFWSLHAGSECCVLPGDARSANGSVLKNGTMVKEGWKGFLQKNTGSLQITCCHGILCVPLDGGRIAPSPPPPPPLPTTTSPTTTSPPPITTPPTTTPPTTTTTPSTTTTPPTTTTPTTTTPKTTTTTTRTKTTTTTTATTVFVVRLSGQPDRGWASGPNAIDAIDFISSEAIQIKGLSLLGSYSGSASLSGRMQIKETTSKIVIASADFTFSSDGGSGFYDQMFSSPQSVEAHKQYTVTVEYFSAQTIHAFNTGGLPNTSAVCNGLTVNFAFSDSSDDNNGSRQGWGQIPRIMFSC